MRTIFIIILLKLNLVVLGQDSADKINLKPIKLLEIETLSQKQKERYQQYKRIDSLDNTVECKKEREEYNRLCQKSIERINVYSDSVKQLNNENKDSNYFYYLVRDCDTLFDFKYCGSYVQSSSDCIDIKLSIEKIEKSRINLDESSGDVFYYEKIQDE